MRSRITLRRIVPITAACLVALGALQASQVRSVNLETLTERAATIFAGRCTEVRTMHDATIDRMVAYVTFEVDRAVKGDPGSTVTVKLLAGQSIVGLPRFQEGEEVVLFLYGESELGLTSPVGFGQGKFSVIEDKLNRKIAVNEFGNRDLMKGVSGQARSKLGTDYQIWSGKRELESDALLDMIEKLR